MKLKMCGILAACILFSTSAGAADFVTAYQNKEDQIVGLWADATRLSNTEFYNKTYKQPKKKMVAISMTYSQPKTAGYLQATTNNGVAAGDGMREIIKSAIDKVQIDIAAASDFGVPDSSDVDSEYLLRASLDTGLGYFGSGYLQTSAGEMGLLGGNL